MFTDEEIKTVAEPYISSVDGYQHFNRAILDNGSLKDFAHTVIKYNNAKVLADMKSVAYLRWEDGAPLWSEDCVCKDDVYTNNGDDDSFGMPIYSADQVSTLIQRNSEMEALLVKIDRMAESGLCAGAFAGAREFFKDIRGVLKQHHD